MHNYTMKFVLPTRTLIWSSLLLAAALASGVPAVAQQEGSVPGALVTLQPAPTMPRISHTLLLDAARAGSRIVAVGEGGTVAISDDDGKHFRRARTVPVQAALTSVFFVDEKLGWAVGHWGLILHTADGGETWSIQAQDLSADRPLYSVWFKDANAGVAVGLWSKVLRTVDGGKTWNPVQVGAPEQGAKADRNLFHLFTDRKGNLFSTAEAGWLLRSRDSGETWQYIKTGYAGSLWAGIALSDGALLVGGLRGTVLRSNDDGASWTPVVQPIPRAVTSFAQEADGTVYAAGLDGLWLRSEDGRNFVGQQIRARPTLTAIVLRKSEPPLLMSKSGPVVAP